MRKLNHDHLLNKPSVLYTLLALLAFIVLVASVTGITWLFQLDKEWLAAFVSLSAASIGVLLAGSIIYRNIND